LYLHRLGSPFLATINKAEVILNGRELVDPIDVFLSRLRMGWF
jgi:hypothetical protein